MVPARHFALHLLSLGFAVAIAFALIEPVPVRLENATQGMTFPIDKLVHFALFLAAAVPWRCSFQVLGGGGGRRARSTDVAADVALDVLVVVVAALYGGLLELAQGLWTPRDAELGDMVAGALGALATVGILRGIRRVRKVSNRDRYGFPVK